MNCPSCGEIVPDSSLFCMNCGAVFSSNVPENQLYNTNTPAEIILIAVWFDKGMEKVKGFLGGEADKVRRKLTFGLQLVDADKNTTAFDGDVVIKGKIFQGYDIDNGIYGKRWTYLTNVPFTYRLTAHVSEFYRAPGQAKITWAFTQPAPFKYTTGFTVRGEIEVWFTPSGSKQKLYKKQGIFLDPVS